ncbi:hypothetical protein [Oceanobacillus massiliensis]|uniref:hypothetical protein n=1 Tax=Oceanobacillus massiliensis TaxID=1465765 RepID=UPI00301890FD
MYEESNTIKNLCEKLWNFERENNLFDIVIKEVYIWEIVRFNVYSELSRVQGFYDDAHRYNNRLIDKIKKVPIKLLNITFKNPMFGSYKRDFLIYDHPRKVRFERKNIDIYTESFIQNQDKRTFDIIEPSYTGKYFPNNLQVNRKSRDFERLSEILKKKVSSLKINNNEKIMIRKIEKKLCEYFDVNNIDFYNLIINHLEKFLYRFEYHKKIMKKREPKSIYIVVSYSNFPIIAAAKDLGIEVIEFQHGVITRYHFAYNFSDPSKVLKYFPDKILTFGEYWGKTEGFPKQTKIEVCGFPYLNLQLEKFKGTHKKKNQILFISQGTIGKELSKRAKEVAIGMPDYHFIYKLHPGEYDRWRNEYPDLVEASNLDHFEVIDHNDRNLYSLFAESDYQVGVCSTAIFEGLTLNCKTVLFNLPGIEYMNDLICQGIVQVVHNKEEAINCIKNYELKDFSRDYFFKKEK